MHLLCEFLFLLQPGTERVFLWAIRRGAFFQHPGYVSSPKSSWDGEILSSGCQLGEVGKGQLLSMFQSTLVIGVHREDL